MEEGSIGEGVVIVRVFKPLLPMLLLLLLLRLLRLLHLLLLELLLRMTAAQIKLCTGAVKIQALSLADVRHITTDVADSIVHAFHGNL